VQESSIHCLRRTGVRARQESGAPQAHRNAHATRTPRPGSEQSKTERARGACSERSTKNHRFQSPESGGPGQATRLHRRTKTPPSTSPKGATDNSLGRKFWVRRKRRSGPAKMLIEQCTARPKQCNSPYNLSPLKGEVVENRSTKRVSAQSLL
jgi:hypothetical protein